MQYQQRTFQTTTGGRSAAVCAANGRHAEPDPRGRCFMCGEPLPTPQADGAPHHAE